MHAEDLAVDNGSQTEVVEHLTAVPPHAGAPKLAQALVVEAVDLGYLPRFVVAADEGDAVGIADLECEEEEERLDRVEATVNVVACEKGGKAEPE
jgi:hypothetical protein